MIKNYLIITFRNFLRNKNYTLINVLGLSIGITCCIIIFLLISHDLSFDRFHSKGDRMFRVVRDAANASGVDHSGVTPYPFANAFRNDFPDIPLVTQFHDQQSETQLTVGNEKHLVKNILFADSLFFEVFDFKVLSGNPRKELGEPGKVFLTQSLADKLLKGSETTTIKLDNIIELEVTGILQDPPANSDIQFSMVVSFSSLSQEYLGFDLDQWGLNSAGYSYVALPETVTEEQVEKRFKKFVEKYYTENVDRKQTYFLQPLSEIHFDSQYNERATDRSSLVMLAVLGIFILSIACVNFINLATALAVKKSKEIGVRKTLGAKRSQLTSYFLGETLMITLFSVLLSLGLVEWILPWLTAFLDKSLSLNLTTDFVLIGFLVLLIVTVTILSGLYPALILSKYNPVDVLKNKVSVKGSSGSMVRRVLVTFQFIIAQTLIIGTLIVAGQMEYFRSKPLGFDKDAIINVAMPNNKREMQEALRSRLEANAKILDISYSIGAPVSDSGFGTNFRLANGPADQQYDVNLKLADHHYLETYGLELIAGRSITEAEEKLAGPPLSWEERKYVFVVNESVVKQFGFEKPEDILGQSLTIGLNDITAKVVGVVKDFHTTSMRESIKPVVIMNFPHFYADAGIKISTSNMKETLAFIESTWNALNPDYYFQYEFLDDHLAGLYRQEERTFTLFKVFSAISIFIGCLGLYGLISFMANQKLKEVGIRKVMGASIISIVTLFSKEFVRIILLAFVIATPLAWYAMNKWLQGFAYRIDIPWYVFAIAITATLVIALATVSFRAIKAAGANPVDTLRTE